MACDDYSLYILRCADDSLYTGIARDVGNRIHSHANGPNGAKYLRGRLPLTLVFEQAVGSRAEAQRFEARVKKLRRAEKLALIDGVLTLAALARDQVSGSAAG